jgi:hypothetical protein
VLVPLTYAVELAERPGTTLVVTSNRQHPSNWFERPATPVLPADVASAVRLARAKGWAPATPGAPFRLDQPEGFLPAGSVSQHSWSGHRGGMRGCARTHRANTERFCDVCGRRWRLLSLCRPTRTDGGPLSLPHAGVGGRSRPSHEQPHCAEHHPPGE